MPLSRRDLLAASALGAAGLALGLPRTGLAADGATLAVLYFHNQGNPELAPLKVGLTQMLITDLQRATADRAGLRIVERTQLQAILDELELGHSGVVDPDTAAKVGKLLGASHLVLGSYFALAGTLRVDARLVRVETGEVAFAHGVSGATAEFIGLEQRLGAALAGALDGLGGGGEDAAPTEGPAAEGPAAEGARASGTTGGSVPGEAYVSGRPGSGKPVEIAAPDPEALQAAVAFGQGLIHMDQGDLARAREAFEEATAADPALAAARDQLAAMEL